MSDDIAQLSIKNLLSAGDRYLIPMYQRNYAWDEAEIAQLIQDIIDYQPGGRPYYIGTLVVFERHENGHVLYETIDGQQRLTTLSLLASYLKNEKVGDLSWYKELGVHFESRKNSQATFAAIFNDTFENDPSEVLREDQINTAILNGYRLIKKILPQKLNEHKLDNHQFAEYLFGMVQIMRVKVPPDTDLNHYFEIMNNRGEQLEKHEVLKSRLMEVLNSIKDDDEREESQACLHTVWEACANMERYSQMGFTPEQRNAIFGDKNWGKFNVGDFNVLRDVLKKSGVGDSSQGVCQSLDEIMEKKIKSITKSDKEDEPPERFNTVINFPNFLLHVLRVTTAKDIPLDDKRLISTFEDHLLKVEDAITKVKSFTFSLLRCKYLFDQYVIKREFIKGSDGWSLKRFKWNDGGAKSRYGRGNYVNTFGEENGDDGDNRRILMLLSAFHVSTPTLVYKHWLNAVLYWLFKVEKIKANTYLRHLESVAKAFVFDRFLAADGGADYYDIIFKNKGDCKTLRDDISKKTLRYRLSFDGIENNLVFNYLDYLLWRKYKKTIKTIRDYEFTFRSSVEHFYPQHPMPGHDALPSKKLNSFGNLCLISHSRNSRLSNFMPEAKKEHYRNNTIDSIKQYMMMDEEKYKTWDETAIAHHYEAMKSVLLKSLGQDVNYGRTV